MVINSKEYMREYMREYRKRPEYNAYQRRYRKEYRKLPHAKEYHANYIKALFILKDNHKKEFLKILHDLREVFTEEKGLIFIKPLEK